MTPFGLAASYLSRQKGRVAAAFACRAVYELAPMQLPILTGAIVSAVAHEQARLYGFAFPADAGRQALGAATVGLFLLAVLHGASSYARWTMSARVSRRFVGDLRRAVVKRLVELPLGSRRRFGSGELLDRALADTANLTRFVERVFIQALSAVIRLGYPLAMLVWIDPRLTLLSLSALPPQWWLARRLQRRLRGATLRSRESQADLASDIQESLEGAETLQALTAEGRIARSLQRGTDRLEAHQFGASRLAAGISGSVWLATGIGLALTWWHGGLRVLAGEMSVGTLVVFSGYVALAYRPLQRFTTIVNTYHRGIVSLGRLADLLSLSEALPEARGAPDFAVRTGVVELEGVSVARGNRDVLDSVSLRVPPRMLTAIVGRNGSGKSTLLRLMARFEDADAGEVRIDGQKLRAVTLASLRDKVALVPQSPAIFSATLLDNVRLGRPDAPEAEVRAICGTLLPSSFLDRLPEGFATRVGRGGATLSGGERQRVAIARALLRRPRVLLMDEPTAALDREAEVALVATLRQLARTMTVVVVAHRSEAVRCADRVVLLDRGQVVDTGRHPELMARNPLYRTLFEREGTEAALQEVCV